MHDDVSTEKNNNHNKKEIVIKCQDIKYKILTLLIFINFYSAGSSVKFKEDIEHTNFIIKNV